MTHTHQPIASDLHWYIEFEGERIGELCFPQYEDMFWITYQVIPYNEESAVLLFNANLWLSCAFQFKNQVTLKYAENAIASIVVASQLTMGKVSMRGLY